VDEAVKSRRRALDVTLRALDIAAAATGLVFLFPLFVAVAVAIRCESRGPVFFRQERMGKAFRPFHMCKFRTMVQNAAELGDALTVGGDRRITFVGRLLRKTKVDELPQLINVLKGEMSLVGPRPEMPEFVDMFRHDYETLLSVPPGITDPGSIAFRNESELLATCEDPRRAYVEWILPQKILLSNRYIEQRSLKMYFCAVWRTLLTVFAPHATEQALSRPGEPRSAGPHSEGKDDVTRS